MEWIKKRYWTILFIVFAFGLGFLVGSVLSGTTLAAISGGSLAALLGAAAGFLFRLWLNKRDLDLAHRHTIVQEKARVFHEYAEQYYEPMCARATKLQSYLNETRTNAPPKDRDIEISFFGVLQWFGILKKWVEEKGGTIFLEDLTREKVIKVLLYDVENSFTNGGYLDKSDLFAIKQTARPHIEWTEFNTMIKNNPLDQIYGRYKNWIYDGDIEQCTSCLCCLSKLLVFEVNVAMKPWYGISFSDPICSDPCEHLITTIQKLDDSEKQKKQYMKKLGLN